MLSNIFQHKFIKNIGNSVLYFGASVIGLIVSIFSTPIFAKYMEAEDFATVGYWGAIDGFMFPLYTLLFYSFYISNFFKNSIHENEKTLGTIIIFLFIWNIILGVFAYVALSVYFDLFKVSFPLFPFALVIILTSVFSIYKTLLSINYRLRKSAWRYFYLMTSSKILNIFFSVFFVKYFYLGAFGKLSGILLGEIVIAILSVFYLKKFIKWHFEKKIVISALKFSIPLVIASFPHLVITNYDKVLLEKLNNVNDFALYTIGSTIAGYLMLFCTSIFQAFEPDVYKLVNNGNYKKLFNYIAVIMLMVFVSIIIFNLFSETILAYLTANRYTQAFKYANIISISVLFYALFSFLSSVLLALNKSKTVSFITMIVGFSGVLIYNYFIDFWSFYGAAYTKILLFMLLSLISLLYIIKVIRKEKLLSS